MERGTVRVKCLAQEHKTMFRPGLQPRPLNPEASALTMRPLHLYNLLFYTMLIIYIQFKSEFGNVGFGD